MTPLREKMLREMQRRNYSSRTINSYLSSLVSLSVYYGRSPDQISIGELKAYLHHCITEQHCSKSRINQTISAYKILYQDLLGKKWSTVSVSRPRREKRLPVILSREEVNALLHALSNLKHRAILSLSYSSGLRISEVVALKLSDIDSGRMQVRVVQGKGNKDRYTILSKQALHLLRAYYRQYRPKKWLFEGMGPTPCPYSRTSIQNIVRKAARRAGITKKVTHHTLRHCFATHLLEQGTGLHIIQYMLGHANARTTSLYLHLQSFAPEKLISPLDAEV